MNLQLLQQIKDYFEAQGYKLEFVDIGVPQVMCWEYKYIVVWNTNCAFFRVSTFGNLFEV